ncbi:sulfurtransferase [Pseudothauera nasutitermitis]|uniref:Sulfurtransferase n=1 Tax=Pseudothauera nasutitermitis TaxID=2565930 RepID=A0A4S4ART4_9RHOO|nr:sulfurtransferase [Pseudothauera nasutitermitis]THF62418.1 sulfurtransferase [Pseudothauera nasutitermitis]
MSTAAFTTLIGADDLARHLNEPDWCLVDCRHDLANPAFGREAYARGHLPGACFLHLDDDLSGPRTGTNGRHPLPDPQRLAQRLGECGIGPHTQVVAYDDAGGMFAARLWWLLRWLGHSRVAVLDGGFQAWCAAAGVLSTEEPPRRSVPFRAEPQPGGVDATYVERHLGQPDRMVILDARSPDRFRGENENLDPVGGHIPGAFNRFFKDNLDANGCFKPAAVLREEFTAALRGHDPRKVVNQCGSGVTACHNQLSMEVAGLSGSRLYPGSWSEWCADPARPVATGPQ